MSSRLTLQDIPGQRTLLQGPQMLLIEFLLRQDGLSAFGHFALIRFHLAIAFRRLGILLPNQTRHFVCFNTQIGYLMCWRNLSIKIIHLLRATWAAMTLCRSTTNKQFVHWHSFHRQSFLWPLRQETTP